MRGVTVRTAPCVPHATKWTRASTCLIPVHGSGRAEGLGEMKTVFNKEQMSGFHAVVPTDAAGNPTTALPTDGYGFPSATGYEQRKFQLGFKVRF